MDSYNYQHEDVEISRVYPSLYNIEETEDDNRSLLDMDSHVWKKERMYYSEPIRKKCLLGNDNEDIINDKNNVNWLDKPIKNWSQEETIDWLISAAFYIGQPYSLIKQSLAISGKELFQLTREHFLNHDSIYGDKLYDLLHSQEISNLVSPNDTSNRFINTEDEFTHSIISDTESENGIVDIISIKRQPGRPARGFKTKKHSFGQGKLWEFIRDLLRNRETCPSLICWEDYGQAKFRFVRSDEVAKRWGSRKGNTKMTYEKLSRAMRYYYKSKIFQPVLGRRLVYQFGPNAKGWQTDNPNFRH